MRSTAGSTGDRARKKPSVTFAKAAVSSKSGPTSGAACAPSVKSWSSAARRFTVIGIDTCRGSGPEGPRRKDYHGAAVAQGGGTFAGTLHRNILECGYGDAITVIIADAAVAVQALRRPVDRLGPPGRASRLRECEGRHRHLAAEGQVRRLAVGGRLRSAQMAGGQECRRRGAAARRALVDPAVAMDRRTGWIAARSCPQRAFRSRAFVLESPARCRRARRSRPSSPAYAAASPSTPPSPE